MKETIFLSKSACLAMRMAHEASELFFNQTLALLFADIDLSSHQIKNSDGSSSRTVIVRMMLEREDKIWIDVERIECKMTTSAGAENWVPTLVIIPRSLSIAYFPYKEGRAERYIVNFRIKNPQDRMDCLGDGTGKACPRPVVCKGHLGTGSARCCENPACMRHAADTIFLQREFCFPKN